MWVAWGDDLIMGNVGLHKNVWVCVWMMVFDVRIPELQNADGNAKGVWLCEEVGLCCAAEGMGRWSRWDPGWR